MTRGRLILTSNGLNTSVGQEVIGRELQKDGDLKTKKIMLFCEPYFSVLQRVIHACERIGFVKEHILLPDQRGAEEEVLKVDYIYVTEGNTFAILANLRNSDRPFDKKIREVVMNGATYIGASAGAAIAGTSVEHILEFDENHKRLSNFEGLGLFDGIVLPHHTEKELQKYLQQNPQLKEKYKEIYSISEEGIITL